MSPQQFWLLDCCFPLFLLNEIVAPRHCRFSRPGCAWFARSSRARDSYLLPAKETPGANKSFLSDGTRLPWRRDPEFMSDDAFVDFLYAIPKSTKSWRIFSSFGSSESHVLTNARLIRVSIGDGNHRL
jgi:hypothetical protein